MPRIPPHPLAAPELAPPTAHLTFRGVAVDQPVPGGPHYARGETWKMRFEPGHAVFLPLLGAGAERHWPVRFGLSVATVGGRPLPLGTGEVRQAAPQQLHLDRGEITEVWDLAPDHVEQSFVCPRPLGPGDLRFEVACATDMAVHLDAFGSLVFTSPLGSGVRCGDAVVVDAAGRRLGIDIGWQEGRMQLCVPAGFLAEATWPVVVDPIVSVFGVAQTPTQFQRPRAALDPTTNVWLVVCEDVVTATDTDVLAFRLTLAGSVLDTTIVEGSTLRAQRPDVAANVPAGKFLVAWLMPGQSRIAHRHRSAAGVTYEPEADFPTVLGNDAELSLGGTQAGGTSLLVWSTDLTFLDTLQALTIDAQNQRGTAISLLTAPSVGALSTTDRRLANGDWGLAVDHTNGVRFFGLFETTNGLTTSPGLDLPGHVRGAAVAGAGPFVIASFDGGAPAHVLATRVSARLQHNYAVDFQADLTQLENTPSNTTVRSDLTFASDGARFVYSYREDHTNTPTATVLNTIRQVSGGLSGSYAFDERRIGVGRVGPEPSLCAAGATGGPAGAYLLLEVDSGPNLAGVRYDGHAPGAQFTTAQTRCGAPFAPLIGAQGASVLGGTYEVRLSRTTGVPMLLGGFPETTPVPTCAADPTCLRGVQLPAPTLVFAGSLVVTVPVNGNLLGLALAFQGIDLLGVGGCPASEFGIDFRLSDTLVAVVR